MSNVVKEDIFDVEPGMGLNANPFEGEIYIDLTSPLGQLTPMQFGLIIQLRKLGFDTLKIDETIDVDPVFKQYYDLTIQQRAALEGQVKAGLGQIATAIHDYELIFHDLRKYKEYLDYFTKIEQGNVLKRKAKKKEDQEKAEQMIKEGMQLLRSVFIDQVDAHTGETIALNKITVRWPTIIVDFQRLDDMDIDQKKIAEKYHFSEAEGAVLATKNKIFIEWRDNLFKPTLKDRYQNILRLVEARRTSIKRYTEMLRPTIARFKLINDALENRGRSIGATTAFYQRGIQAFSLDSTRIWAFQPIAPAEKYKVTRNYLDEVSAKEAGFKKNEMEQLINAGKITKDNKNVLGLPVEPSIDSIIRRYMPAVEKHYGVKIDITDVFDARNRLVSTFTRKMAETPGGKSFREFGEGLRAGAPWMFSPYFVFIDIPFVRLVFKAPNGQEFENLMVDNLTVQNRSQNVVIVCLLEIIAREKQLDNYINQLLGEVGGTGLDLKTIEELAKEQYPEFFGGMRKEMKMKGGKELMKGVKTSKSVFGDVLKSIGFAQKPWLYWLRARGPYEFAMDDRIAEMFQVEAMVQGYLYVLRYLQRGMGVPGIRV